MDRYTVDLLRAGRLKFEEVAACSMKLNCSRGGMKQAGGLCIHFPKYLYYDTSSHEHETCTNFACALGPFPMCYSSSLAHSKHAKPHIASNPKGNKKNPDGRTNLVRKRKMCVYIHNVNIKNISNQPSLEIYSFTGYYACQHTQTYNTSHAIQFMPRQRTTWVTIKKNVLLPPVR